MVIGIHRITRGIERLRQPRIARRMLRQAVRNLDHRLRLVIFLPPTRKPAVDKQINAIRRGQRESRSPAHRSFVIISAPNWDLFYYRNRQKLPDFVRLALQLSKFLSTLQHKDVNMATTQLDL